MQSLKILGLFAVTPLLAVAQLGGIGAYDSLPAAPGVLSSGQVGVLSTGVSAVTPGIVPNGKGGIRAGSIATSIARTPLPRTVGRRTGSRCPSQRRPLGVNLVSVNQPAVQPPLQSRGQAPPGAR